MRPYIAINGVSSRTVDGLLIQSLPPISKPLMRTEIEEINGRDGDIVTPLGYSAYDKELTIGLYGEYDITEVINFFNQSGKVVFSNEPDKYYNFAQYAQIDLNKLIRYKTAKVKLHVQPFKYSEDETTITNTYEDVTSATITVRNGGNIYSRPTLTITGKGTIGVYLNTVQVLNISLDDTSAETIIISGSEMNAYSPDGIYMNRQVTGNYDNLVLNTGVNTLLIEGNITSVLVDNYSRWI